MAAPAKESIGAETSECLVAFVEAKNIASPRPNRTIIFQNPREISNWQQQQQNVSGQGQSLETADQVTNRCRQKHRCCQRSRFCKYLTYVLPLEHHHHSRHHRQHRNRWYNHQISGLQQSEPGLVRATENRFSSSSITLLSDCLRLSPKFKRGQIQSSLMTILMFVVAFSGHAVIASQRDATKSESVLGKNANVIPYMINPAQSNGNTDDVSNENVNFYNAIISSLTAVPDIEKSMSLTTGNSMSSGNSPIASTAPVMTVASTAATSSGGGAGTGSNSLWATSRNTIEGVDENRGGPYFDKSASKNITALLGKTAYLNCRVKNLGNKTMLLQVSWVRHRDIHLLTVGRYTYTSDQRFRAIHQPQTEDWVLQIKYPQHRDAGIYECQVSTTPHMSHYIYLSVVEPSTEIIGAPDLYIESGSTINLTCVILNSPEPPAYIFWNHNNAIINYDSPRGGVSVVTHKGETTTSFLLIKSARPSDSGHYQCNPSNAKPKSVTVHVLNGEFPAAMQHAAQAFQRMSLGRCLLVYLLIYCCSSAYVRCFISWHPSPK